MPEIDIRKWSREDVFIYLLFSPAMVLYILADRFPLIYATPFMYAIPAAADALKQKFSFESRLKGVFKTLVFPVFLLIQTALVLVWHDEVFLYKPLVRDLIIHSGFFLLILIPGNFSFRHIRFLFLVLIFSYLAWIDYSDPFALISLLFSSRPPTEFDMGLFFGLFSIYFLFRKNFFWLFASLIVLIFVSKRVVYLGLVLSALWFLMQQIRTPLIQSILRQYMLLPIFIAATLFCFFMIPFLQLIFGNDATSLNQIDAFLSGRLNAILFEIKAISESSLWQKILGHGAGQLDVQLSLHQPVPWAKVFPEPTNPHNDYLKILFDFGITGSFAYAISLQSRYTKTQFGFALLVFSWTLFFFENALIHIYFNMISAILLQAFENEQKNESLVRG